LAEESLKKFDKNVRLCVLSGQGAALLPLIFFCALEYVIRACKENQDGLKRNVTFQPLLCGGGVNLLSENN
jgi:hypothetical protein